MNAASLQVQGRPLVGVLYIALAVFGFALADVIMKYLSAIYPVPVIGSIRYLVNVVLLLVLLGPQSGAALWKTNRTWLVILRALSLSLATLTMGWALRVLPVGETVAILYLSPLAVMLLAVPVLGERVGPLVWIGAAFGFLGVLLIVRPGSGLDPVGVFLALLNAGVATIYHLLSRLLSRTETTIPMLFTVGWVGLLVFGVLAIPELGSFNPTLPHFGLMCLMGLLATTGHFLLTAAYREAPAPILAPINYLHLVWAGGLGWLVFGHLPDAISLLGMALVTGAGAAVAWFSHSASRRDKPVTPV